MQTLAYTGSRVEEIRGLFDASGLCLEIGPSYNPILPKAEGYAVETIDYCDAAGLRAKYESHPGVDRTKIEEVDHIWRGEPLSEIVGEGRFDVVVASHVIEHTPDMLGFLLECEKTLAPEGRLVLVVPDRRRCFDFFRPASTTGSVLQAHFEGRTRHSAGSAFDFVANYANLEPAGPEAPSGRFTLPNPVTAAAAAAARFRDAGSYEDCHAWVYTPSSFRLIASDLAAAGLLGLREEGFWETPIFEFVTILSRAGGGCPLDRPALLAAAHREAAEPAAPQPPPG
jgi:SAM-dependent methyltransferase